MNYDPSSHLGSRFRITHSEGAARGAYVIVDKETGVNYLFVKFGAAGGLTPLLGRDGRPVITPPEPFR